MLLLWSEGQVPHRDSAEALRPPCRLHDSNERMRMRAKEQVTQFMG